MARHHDHQTKVVLFSKHPTPGKAKTRLIPALGPDGAAFAQVVMTEKVLGELSDAGFPSELWYAGKRGDIEGWLGRRFPGLHLEEQVSGGLGERIAGAFDSAFARGASKVIIVGADIPSLSKDDVRRAADALSIANPMVIQPATDGGYVLVGLHCCIASSTKPLFCSGTINWGTETVLDEQKQAASAASVSLSVIGEPRDDVDYVEDLPHLLRSEDPPMNASLFSAPAIGIVCPILNEASSISRCIMQWLGASTRKPVQIVLSDGGSTDGTLDRIENLKAGLPEDDRGRIKVVASAKGRGAQFHTGVEALSGECDIVLMVHADTTLPDAYDSTVCEILRTPGVAMGAFRLALDSSTVGTDIAMYGAYLRSVYMETPYGDQALFMLRRTLRNCGGIREDFPLLEDLELVARARKVGRIVTCAKRVLTSARRYSKHGVVKVTAANQVVLAAYALGVPPPTLFAWYYKGVPGYWIPYAVAGALIAFLLFCCIW